MENDLGQSEEEYGVFFEKQEDGSWKAKWVSGEDTLIYVNFDIDALVDEIMVDQGNSMKAVLWAAELQGNPNITIN